MERTKLNILCWLLIVLYSSQIPSRLALENATTERSKSLALVQESRVLETVVTWNSNGESMKHDMMSIAKGQKGGRGSGGGSINRTPHNASTKVFHHVNLLKTMVGHPRGGTTFATSTSPKMKAYLPAADHRYGQSDQKPRGVKGAYVPVYISLGLIMLSVSIGVFTATHQLKRSPNVFVRKSKRESFPELVDPEKVAEESDDFIKKSFFRKIAHVQDADRQDIIPDPIRGDTYTMHPKPLSESLKSVGVEVEKKPFVEPLPLKH